MEYSFAMVSLAFERIKIFYLEKCMIQSFLFKTPYISIGGNKTRYHVDFFLSLNYQFFPK